MFFISEISILILEIIMIFHYNIQYITKSREVERHAQKIPLFHF